MIQNSDGTAPGDLPVAGGSNHVWEREHRHPTSSQLRAMGSRRRDAEMKLERHQQEARLRAGGEHPTSLN